MYKKVISVLGSKGGSSKTTTSHLISHGLAKLGIRVVLLTTDNSVSRKSLTDTNRSYTTFSAQNSETMNRAIHAFKNLDCSEVPAVLVVDGGGNRVETDNIFAQFSDLIILPFRDSEEDFRVVSADMNRLSDAVALPSAWPANPFAFIQAQAILSKMESEFSGRIMQPVPSMRATQQLLKEDFAGVNSEVTNLAKRLAESALNRLGINPFESNLVK
jgi:chromosome partitioning protein